MAISKIDNNALGTITSIDTGSATGLTLKTNGVTALTIDGSQNVGIGTSSPTGKLHAQGTNSGIYFDLTTAYTPKIIASGALSDIQIEAVGSGGCLVNKIAAGTGTFQWVQGATERMRIDTAGNVGIGVTPTAWTTYKAISIAGTGQGVAASSGGESHLLANAYYNSGWKYAATQGAARFSIGEGYNDFRFYTAPSGTAGNAITFTEAMTLNASGQLQIGDSNIYGAKLNITETNNNTTGWTYFWVNHPTLKIRNLSVTPNTLASINFENGTAGSAISSIAGIQEASNLGALVFHTGGGGRSNTVPERMRIDSAGIVTIGGSRVTREKDRAMWSGTAVSSSLANIVTANQGYVQFSTNYNGDSSVFEVVTSGAYGIKIKKPGWVYYYYDQDIVTSGTTSYISLQVKYNGSSPRYQLISNTNGIWDAISIAAVQPVSENDILSFYLSATDITQLDAGDWSNCSFIWHGDGG